MSCQQSVAQPGSESNDPIGSVLIEDNKKFKTCNQIGFYRRQKQFCPNQSPYEAQLNTLKAEKDIVTFNIIHQETKVPLHVQVFAIKGNILRLKVNDVSPLKPRYEVPDVLMKEPTTDWLKISQRERDSVTLECQNASAKVHITAKPFSILVTHNDNPLIGVNSQGRLYFEHLILPPSKSDPEIKDSKSVQHSSKEIFGEKFENDQDHEINALSVGLDFTLHGFEHVYGLPEHADTHRLKNTGENEAYRLYNLDVFGYPVYDKLGTYGSVPLLLAHKPLHTCGIFWLNASDTLVEILSKAALQSPLNREDHDTPKKKAVPKVDIRWMSECGIVDVFLLLGPSPQHVFKQYAQLTGTQTFPPRFSLGYHQCRWNYEDEADVEAVDSGFDKHNIPYDVIWLDIEHTDGKRYFTWDQDRFPNPVKMQENLRKKRRKVNKTGIQ